MDKELKSIISKSSLLEDKDNNYQETVVVTGGNSGLGLEFIKLCLKEHYKVIFTTRSKSKGEDTLKALKQDYKDADVRYMLLDLCDFNSIDNFVNEIINNNIDVHHFYNNAGIFRIPYKDIDGFEINWLTNYFGPLVLNEKLNKYFLTLNHKVHINFIYSCTTYWYRFDEAKFNIDHQIGKMDNYAQTKHGVVFMYKYMSEKYKDSNLVFSLSHPGATYTPLIVKGFTKNKVFQMLAKCFMKLFFHTAEKASYTYRLSLRYVPNNSYIAPRGLFEISGYPKVKKLKEKQYKNYEVIINKSLQKVKKYL